jgi:hypothetical protein
MNTDSFYAILSGICFALTGLQPIKVEAFLICIIILNGHGLGDDDEQA